MNFNIHERGMPYEKHQAVKMFFNTVQKYKWCEVIEVDGDRVVLQVALGPKVVIHKDCLFTFVKYGPLRY